MRLWRGRGLSVIVGLLALLGVSLAPAPVAWADVAQQPILTAGAVVSLQGTPHLWIADDEETLHWVGDTRALAERQVNWEHRTEVTLSELQDLRRGDPWLSAGLLKDGALLYLVQWPSDDAVPRLLHIQSVADIELFGISWRNYGALVYEPAAWEREFGLRVASLQRGALPLVTGPILAWGEFGDTPGEFDDPRGIAVDAAGHVYVADYDNDRIQKLSTAGQPLAQWGTSGGGPGQFRGPRSVALDAQGNIYIADYWSHRIQKLSPTGQPLAQWGTYGQAPGQFDHPTAVAVDTHGNVYVAEYWAHRVQKLSPTGEPLAVWGSQGSDPGPAALAPGTSRSTPPATSTSQIAATTASRNSRRAASRSCSGRSTPTRSTRRPSRLLRPPSPPMPRATSTSPARSGLRNTRQRANCSRSASRTATARDSSSALPQWPWTRREHSSCSTEGPAASCACPRAPYSRPPAPSLHPGHRREQP